MRTAVITRYRFAQPSYGGNGHACRTPDSPQHRWPRCRIKVARHRRRNVQQVDERSRRRRPSARVKSHRESNPAVPGFVPSFRGIETKLVISSRFRVFGCPAAERSLGHPLFPHGSCGPVPILNCPSEYDPTCWHPSLLAPSPSSSSGSPVLVVSVQSASACPTGGHPSLTRESSAGLAKLSSLTLFAQSGAPLSATSVYPSLSESPAETKLMPTASVPVALSKPPACT